MGDNPDDEALGGPRWAGLGGKTTTTTTTTATTTPRSKNCGEFGGS